MKYISSLVSLILVTMGTHAMASADLMNWQKNYTKMVSFLLKPQNVGQCSVSISSIENSPKGSWMVNFLTGPDVRHPGANITNFVIIPPLATHGETQVDLLANHIIRYRQSDMAGWLVLTLQLDPSDSKIIKMETSRVLPNGMDLGNRFTCGK